MNVGKLWASAPGCPGGCMLAFQRTCLYLVSFHHKYQTKDPLLGSTSGTKGKKRTIDSRVITETIFSYRASILKTLKGFFGWNPSSPGLGKLASLPRAFTGPHACALRPSQLRGTEQAPSLRQMCSLSFGLHLFSSLFVLGPHDAKQLVWLVFVSVNGWDGPIWCSLETDRGFTEGSGSLFLEASWSVPVCIRYFDTVVL